MKRKLTEIFKLLSLVLSVLGLSQCDNDDIICMYGCPTEDYSVKDSVTDESLEPIESAVPTVKLREEK